MSLKSMGTPKFYRRLPDVVSAKVLKTQNWFMNLAKVARTDFISQALKTVRQLVEMQQESAGKAPSTPVQDRKRRFAGRRHLNANRRQPARETIGNQLLAVSISAESKWIWPRGNHRKQFGATSNGTVSGLQRPGSHVFLFHCRITEGWARTENLCGGYPAFVFTQCHDVQDLIWNHFRSWLRRCIQALKNYCVSRFLPAVRRSAPQPGTFNMREKLWSSVVVRRVSPAWYCWCSLPVTFSRNIWDKWIRHEKRGRKLRSCAANFLWRREFDREEYAHSRQCLTRWNISWKSWPPRGRSDLNNCPEKRKPAAERTRELEFIKNDYDRCADSSHFEVMRSSLTWMKLLELKWIQRS